MPADPVPARPLVEPERVGVVVRSDQPEPLPSVCACVIDDRVEQRGSGAGAAVGRDDHDELGVTVDLVPERAANRTTVVLDDEAVEHRGIVVYPPARYEP